MTELGAMSAAALAKCEHRSERPVSVQVRLPSLTHGRATHLLCKEAEATHDTQDTEEGREELRKRDLL